ncbi:hypothetical protein [Luteococcus peritonei]|uniref:DUF2283 domain-containing protein n=1 Tax=Luteococcus peritonei TaxID=88874 RepID=A0ABW4RUP2_9ACTN
MGNVSIMFSNDDAAECHFDDSELSASYSAEMNPEGDVVVTIDVYRGTDLVSSVPVGRFPADDVDGFTQDS